jgi:hypothetical protein
MNDEHVFALVETIDGANLHAIHKLALDARFIDDVGQMSSSLWPMVAYQSSQDGSVLDEAIILAREPSGESPLSGG